MIRKIKKAKYNDLNETTAVLTFEDDTTAVHQIDDVMREHTSSYLVYIRDGGVVEAFETDAEKAERELKEKIDKIEQHIYTFYSEKKQSQDRGYQSYSQTVIVGVTSQADTPTTLDALTIEVMGVVLQILEGVITLEDYIASKPADLQEHYEKLVKVGLRLKWTKACIDEGKLAVAEGREPNYPTFPVFGLQRIAS